MHGGARDGLALTWAKSSPYGIPADHWAPLHRHLDETADIAGLLWDEWLAPSVRRTISSALPDGEDDGRRLLVWLAGVHDVGKATPAFAVQSGNLCDRMQREAGMTVGPYVMQDRAELRHETAGAAALDEWITARSDMPERRRHQFTCVVAGHHGTYGGVDQVRKVTPDSALYGAGEWARVREALLDRAARRVGVEDRLQAWRPVLLPRPAQMLLTAAVVMADWIASDERFFPLVPAEVVPDPDPVQSEPSARARAAWRAVALGRRWQPEVPTASVDELFVDRFPWAESGPRPEQRAIVQVAQRMTAPELMIVEAPMGIGKTEAGLLAAEVLAARSGSSGMLIALPTQATSGAIFSRARRYLERLPVESDGERWHALTLVHGKAALNEEFATLPRQPRGWSIHDEEVQTPDGPRLRTVAHEWFHGRKRAALAPFVASTIDQVLFGALRARHVMLRQLSLANKVVVIDEVHAADVYMARFLDRTLEWLGAAGAPVILMSATLPGDRRADLHLAYERGRRGAEADPTVIRSRLVGDIGYPVVTASGPDRPQITVLPSSARSSTVRLHRLPDDLPALTALLDERLADGGCAVVIRDTVGRAQRTAEHLAGRFDVTVAHAQFLAADRVENDERLLHEFGAPASGAERPVGRRVVVATQVVEQSLDLDFDLMITDVAPADLVLQRLGRLHRHDRRERPARLREAECWITGVDWDAEVPRFDRGPEAVYGRWPLLASIAVLNPHLDGTPLVLPTDIAPLVQTAYAEDLTVPAHWEEVAAAARRTAAEARARREQAADTFAIDTVGKPGAPLYGLSRAGHGTIDEDSPAGQGTVRDGADAIEVVVVQRGRDRTDRVPDWVTGGGEALPFRHVPLDRDQALALARCTLRLPAGLTRSQEDLDAVIKALEDNYFPGWQETPLLSGQLALVLDDEGRADLAGRALRYDRERGLLVHHIKEDA